MLKCSPVVSGHVGLEAIQHSLVLRDERSTAQWLVHRRWNEALRNMWRQLSDLTLSKGLKLLRLTSFKSSQLLY